ncbi:hypothetical protein NECAME_04594 [Necator americanus]|uniref:Uncharacterized protein n=1 Tax=Necator americanus TaxID=51031 RepID=W2SQF8_NECAM|nr:hypothetical protein NECAME_04594 [Necator americanus]ETN71850.1 hypothetical protein NECAME_04594 [Necator americanus]
MSDFIKLCNRPRSKNPQHPCDILAESDSHYSQDSSFNTPKKWVELFSRYNSDAIYNNQWTQQQEQTVLLRIHGYARCNVVLKEVLLLSYNVPLHKDISIIAGFSEKGAISARGDLNTPDSTHEVESMGFRDHAELDYKARLVNHESCGESLWTTASVELYLRRSRMGDGNGGARIRGC